MTRKDAQVRYKSDMSYPRNFHSKYRPVSVREAAAMLNMSSQRLGYFIRNGDLPAHSLNGHDYVLWRDDVLEFDRKRRHSHGHPSQVEVAQRRPPRHNNRAVLDRVGGR